MQNEAEANALAMVEEAEHADMLQIKTSEHVADAAQSEVRKAVGEQKSESNQPSNEAPWGNGYPGLLLLKRKEERRFAELAASSRKALDEAQQRWYQPPGEEQLFDLQHDPHEPGHASVPAPQLPRAAEATGSTAPRACEWSMPRSCRSCRTETSTPRR